MAAQRADSGHTWRRVVNRSFKRLLRRTGLPNIRFHDLWHTCATLMLGIGLNPKVAQKRIGHSNQAACKTVPQPR